LDIYVVLCVVYNAYYAHFRFDGILINLSFYVIVACFVIFCLRKFVIALYIVCITPAASSRKRNVTVWRPSVCLSVPSAHTQRDSPEGSTRRGQRAYEDGHTRS